jgi:uncharacterized membrane protein
LLIFIGLLFSFMSETQPVSHHRKQFQVDRICYFSDAIIAIAITLLVLEFKLPPLGKDKTWLQIKSEYGPKLTVPVVGMLLSFYLISNYWIRHHELFEHVVNYNKKLVKYNLLFLGCIMVLPLVTSFMLEKDNPWFLKNFFYFADMGFCSLFYYLLHRTVYSRKNRLSSQDIDADGKMTRNRSVFFEIAFFGSAIWSVFSKEHFLLPLWILILLPISRIYHQIKISIKKRKVNEGNPMARDPSMF